MRRLPSSRSSGSGTASTAGCRSTGGRSCGARRAAAPATARNGVPVAILLDPSAVVAAADTADLNHRSAVGWFERVDEPLLLGALGLAELDILLQRELGSDATRAVIDSLLAGSIRLVSPTAG